MSISFIIPIYNVEKYLKQCIDSVLGQVKEEDEIILVNDGSKDRSNLICKKYLKMFPDKIIYIEKENGGLSSARNVGIRQATKDYIAFVDSDDYLKQGYVEVLDDWMELVEHAVKRIERWKMTKTDWITMIFPVIANGLLLYLFHKVIEKKFERVGKRNELRDEVIILFWKKCNK